MKRKNRRNSGDLTTADRSIIDQVEEACKAVYDPKIDGSFKLGDICLKGWRAYDDKEYYFSHNSLGAVRKYKVVHVTPSGIFFLKEVDCRGRRVSSKLYYPERLEHHLMYGPRSNKRVWDTWMLDPSQLDAILLGDDFDPNAEGKERASLFTEVNDSNSKIRVNTDDLVSVEKFLRSMKPGDIYWRSVKSYVTVDSVSENVFIPEVTVTRSDNGKKLVLNSKSIMHKRFYKERPRSFWKETAPQK